MINTRKGVGMCERSGMSDKIGVGRWVLGVGQFVISILSYFEGPEVDRSGCFLTAGGG